MKIRILNKDLGLFKDLRKRFGDVVEIVGYDKLQAIIDNRSLRLPYGEKRNLNSLGGIYQFADWWVAGIDRNESLALIFIRLSPKHAKLVCEDCE
jgi:hypothetical protein